MEQKRLAKLEEERRAEQQRKVAEQQRAQEARKAAQRQLELRKAEQQQQRVLAAAALQQHGSSELVSIAYIKFLISCDVGFTDIFIQHRATQW